MSDASSAAVGRCQSIKPSMSWLHAFGALLQGSLACVTLPHIKPVRVSLTMLALGLVKSLAVWARGKVGHVSKSATQTSLPPPRSAQT